MPIRCACARGTSSDATARSRVREATGQQLAGDSASQVWGVLDVLAVTDFPDIRFKAAIKSASGNILVIPREGGYLVRCYVELGELAPGERAGSRGITLDSLVETARRIIHPYTIDVREVAWWSVYEIGQRLTARFDDAGRVPAGSRGSSSPATPATRIPPRPGRA